MPQLLVNPTPVNQEAHANASMFHKDILACRIMVSQLRPIPVMAGNSVKLPHNSTTASIEMKQTTSINVPQSKQTICGVSQLCRH
jgi:hypothetical protein